jgi:hypothetical protein
MMTKTALLALGLLLPLSVPVLAQTVPDPELQRQQTQNAVNQQLLQTQQNNTQMQLQLQQNEARQQQLFNSMPPPAYQQPGWQQPAFVPPPAQK